ncbi:MAG: hypothetical protein VKK03_08340 [Synechococcus sp.]|nr:hypothetical protein [Synechococcus sp.]
MQDSRDERLLPAPYESPWEALRRDLPAAWADIKLRAQELWRRNREGDLAIPSFWPRDLAPLFWPLALSIVFLVTVAGTVQLVGLWPVRASLPPSALPVSTERSEPPTASSNQQEAHQPTRPEELLMPTQASETAELADPLPSDSAPQLKAAEVAAMDPLLEQLWETIMEAGLVGNGQDLLPVATRQPQHNAYLLTMGEGWDALDAARRQRLADLVWESVERAGYSELQLCSKQGNELARTARVGKGMVVFDSTPWPSA